MRKCCGIVKGQPDLALAMWLVTAALLAVTVALLAYMWTQGLERVSGACSETAPLDHRSWRSALTPEQLVRFDVRLAAAATRRTDP
jgi:hypothetical protein